MGNKYGSNPSVTISNTDVVAYLEDLIEHTAVIAIDTVNSEIARGTVMGIITTSGEWGVYDNAETNGLEVARGVLNSDCDVETTVSQAPIIKQGFLTKSLLTGLDATGETDLNVKEYQNGVIRIEGTDV